MNIFEIHPDQMTDGVSALIDARDAARDRFNNAKSAFDVLNLRRAELESELREQTRLLASRRDDAGDALIERRKAKIGELLEAGQHVDLLKVAIARADRLGPHKQLAALNAEADLLVAEYEVQLAVSLAERDAGIEALGSIGAELFGDSGGVVSVPSAKWDKRKAAALEVVARAAELNAQAENLQARLAQLEN